MLLVPPDTARNRWNLALNGAQLARVPPRATRFVSYFELAGSELATPSRSTASTTRAETRELAHLLGEERDRAPDGLSTPTPWQVVPSPSA